MARPTGPKNKCGFVGKNSPISRNFRNNALILSDFVATACTEG